MAFVLWPETYHVVITELAEFNILAAFRSASPTIPPQFCCGRLTLQQCMQCIARIGEFVA